jgi:hypothetical protein
VGLFSYKKKPGVSHLIKPAATKVTGIKSRMEGLRRESLPDLDAIPATVVSIPTPAKRTLFREAAKTAHEVELFTPKVRKPTQADKKLAEMKARRAVMLSKRLKRAAKKKVPPAQTRVRRSIVSSPRRFADLARSSRAAGDRLTVASGRTFNKTADVMESAVLESYEHGSMSVKAMAKLPKGIIDDVSDAVDRATPWYLKEENQKKMLIGAAGLGVLWLIVGYKTATNQTVHSTVRHGFDTNVENVKAIADSDVARLASVL